MDAKTLKMLAERVLELETCIETLYALQSRKDEINNEANKFQRDMLKVIMKEMQTSLKNKPSPDDATKPKYVASVYPLLNFKSGFSQVFFRSIEEKQVSLYLATYMLTRISDLRPNDKYTLIIYKCEGTFEWHRLSHHPTDIAHSNSYITPKFSSWEHMTRRQIIQRIQRYMNDKQSDDDEDEESDESKTDSIDEDGDKIHDLIDEACLSWTDNE